MATICLHPIISPSLLPAQDDRKPIKIQLYRSLLTGLNESQAKPSTKPLIDRLAMDVGYPVEFDISEENDVTELRNFGQQLANGNITIGVVWGTEYSWLRKHHPSLEALVVVSVGDEVNHFSRLMVRKKDGLKELGDLRGKQIAMFRGSLLDDQFYVQSLKLGLQSTDSYKTAKDALFAVKNNNNADCVAVDVATFNNFEIAYSGAAKYLKEIDRSDVFPTPALIGFRQQVDKLEPGLWKKLEIALWNMNSTMEGKQTIRFWKFEKFVEPSERYKEWINKLTRDDSIEEILKARTNQK